MYTCYLLETDINVIVDKLIRGVGQLPPLNNWPHVRWRYSQVGLSRHCLHFPVPQNPSKTLIPGPYRCLPGHGRE